MEAPQGVQLTGTNRPRTYHKNATRPLCGSRSTAGNPTGHNSTRVTAAIAEGKRPAPIPNPEAKPSSADGTAPDRVWESRTPPNILRSRAPVAMGALESFVPPLSGFGRRELAHSTGRRLLARLGRRSDVADPSPSAAAERLVRPRSARLAATMTTPRSVGRGELRAIGLTDRAANSSRPGGPSGVWWRLWMPRIGWSRVTGFHATAWALWSISYSIAVSMLRALGRRRRSWNIEILEHGVGRLDAGSREELEPQRRHRSWPGWIASRGARLAW